MKETLQLLDDLANIYDWHLDKCFGHMHQPDCPVVKLRRKILTLQDSDKAKKVTRGIVCKSCSTERKIANDGTKYLCNHFSEPCKECEDFITPHHLDLTSTL